MAKVAIVPPHQVMMSLKMTLGDSAELTFQHPRLIGDAFVNHTSGLMLVVQKFPSVNTLEVIAPVEQALKGLQHQLPGDTVDPTFSIWRSTLGIQSTI